MDEESGVDTVSDHVEGSTLKVVHVLLPYYALNVGTLVILHQSSKTVLGEDNPIYCVASGHSVKYLYSWKYGGHSIGLNSPVLWPSKPGMYSCRVVDGLKTCSSSVIEVVEKAATPMPEVEVSTATSCPGNLASATNVQEPLSEGTHSLVDGKKYFYLPDPIIFYYLGSAMTFTYESLMKATGDFAEANVIGKGGFGKVFRGTLRHVNVAIKVLSEVYIRISLVCIITACI